MEITICSGLNTVFMDDSGITLSWQQFIPWEKSCSIVDALQVMRRGQIVSTPKLDENNTLAIVHGQEADGYAMLISNKSGATEIRHVYLGRKAFKLLFDTADNYIPDPDEDKYIEDFYDTFSDGRHKE